MAKTIYKSNPLFLKNNRLHLKQLEQRILFDAELASDLTDASIEKNINDFHEQEGTLLAEFAALVENTPDDSVNHQKMVFIDSAVINKEAFIDAASNYSTVIVLDGSQNAWEQISEAVSKYDNISEIHLISHGSQDGIILNNKVYNLDNLADYSTYLKSIQSHVQTGGDFLIYGCNIGVNPQVDEFAKQINLLTSLDVAFSTNDTGNTATSDFNLEYNYGNITSFALNPNNYNYVLNNTADGFGDKDYNGDGTADPLRMITWNVIGLDSNKPETSGPDSYLVGLRVESDNQSLVNYTVKIVDDDGIDVFGTGIIFADSSTPTSDFDDGVDNIKFVNSTIYENVNIDANSYKDFYFNVEVQRMLSSLGQMQPFHFEVFKDDNNNGKFDNGEQGYSLNKFSWLTDASAANTPLYLYVEKLISQARNTVENQTYPTEPTADDTYSAIRVEGYTTNGNYESSPIVLFVGQELNVRVEGATATQGYPQLTFSTYFQNNVFNINTVAQAYDQTSTVNTYQQGLGDGVEADGDFSTLDGINDNTSVYANSAGWNPANHSLMITSAPPKAGGGPIVSDYNVTVTGTGSGQLDTLILDYSGSSFHYNADLDTGTDGIDFVKYIAVKGSIVGRVLADTDGDGVGDSPLAGVTITLNGTLDPNMNGQIDIGENSAVTQITVTTDENGYYVFTDLLPGVYTVAEGSVPNYGDVSDTDGGNKNQVTVVIGKNVNIGTAASLGLAGVLAYSSSSTSEVLAGDQMLGYQRADFVEGQPDLSLTKSANTLNPAPGGQVTFTLTVTNDGSATAPYVEVMDKLPAGLTYVSSSGDGTYDSSSGLWTIDGGVNQGQTKTIQIVCTLVSNEAVSNFAQIVSIKDAPSGNDIQDADYTVNNNLGPDGMRGTNDDGSRIPFEDDEAKVTVQAKESDLSLVKTYSNFSDAGDRPALGDILEFKLIVVNSGPDDATNISIQDRLPSELGSITLVSTSAGSFDTNTGIWDISSLANGETATLIYRGTLIGVSQFSNFAHLIHSDQYDPDSTPDNDTNSSANEDDEAKVVLTPHSSDLTLNKVVDNFAPDIGANVTFTLILTNNGPDASTNVVVKDQLPAGLTWVSGGSFSGGVVTWNTGDIAVGEVKTLQIVATVTSSSAITNFAQITASDMPDPDSTVNNDSDKTANEDDEAAVTITPGATDLSLEKSYVVDDGTMSSIGDVITFTLKVNNTGSKNAYHVKVSDVLEPGLTFLSSAYSGVGYFGTGSYNSSTGIWDVGTVAAGSNATISFKATVTTLLEKHNYAEIIEADAKLTDTAGDGVSTLSDIDSTFNNDAGAKTANEDDEARITIAKVPYADLQLTNVISKVNPVQNEDITFTLTVTNTGYADTTGVAVSYVFPQNTGAASQFSDPSSFVFSDTNDTNTYSSTTGAGTWTIGNLTYGETATLTITVKTPTGSGGDKFTSDLSLFAQISSSSLPDTDSTVANNKGTDTTLGTADDGSRTPYEDDEALATAISPTSTRLDVALDETISIKRSGSPISNATALQLNDEVTVNVTAYNQGGDANSAYYMVKWDSKINLSSATINSSTATNQSVIEYATDATGTNWSATLAANATYIRVKLDTSSAATKLDSGSNSLLTLVGTVNATGVGQNASISAWFADIGSGSDVDADSSVTGINATGSTSNDLSTDDLSDGIVDDDEAILTIGGNQSSDLSITKAISLDGSQTYYNTVSMYDGDTGTLRITITNAGPDFATNVTVNNTLPTGLVYRTSYGYGSYDTGTNTWNIGTLKVGQTASIYVLVDANWGATAATSLTSTSEVKTVDQPDIDSTKNNSVITEDDYASITINKDTLNKADLSLIKTVDNASPNYGDTVKFTLTVSNSGPSTATGVVVKDLLPDGLTYVSDNGAGSYDPITGLYTVGSITSGASKSIEIRAMVTTVNPISNFAQITASDLPDPDSTVNNDTDRTDNEDDEGKVVLNPKSSDLSLTKVVDNTAPNVGDTIKFTLTVLNSGYTNATGVQVKDLIDPSILENISVFSSTGDSNYNAATGIWNIGNVAVGEVVKIEISGKLVSAASFSNFAQIISSDLSDPDSTVNNDTNNVANEDDEGSVLVTPKANDLEIHKSFTNLTDPGGYLDVNDTVQFTITLINAGGVDATNVQIQDYLPLNTYLDNIQILSSKINGVDAGSFNAATGIWNLSSETISAGSIAVLTYTAQVKTADSFDVFAEIVSANEYDVDSTPSNLILTVHEDDEAKVTLDARSADLSLIKSVSKPYPQIGETITFSIDVINSSADDATGVSITDYLTNDFAFVTGSANLSGVYADNPLGIDTLTWSNLTIAGYSKVTLTFRAVALSGIVATNSVQIVSSDVYDPDSSPNDGSGDDLSYVDVDAQSADLSLVKIVNVSTPAQAKIDGYYTATYTIQVRNDGPDATTFVEVKDGLAKGLAYLSSTSNVGSYNPNSGIWQIDSLASGEVQELTIVTKVLIAQDIQNKAEITASSVKDPDSNPNNNSGTEDDESSATVNVEMVDLSLTKFVFPNEPQIGDPMSYQLILRNGINFDAATGVQITDKLPGGFAFTDYIADKGTFNEITGIWDVGTVNPGEVITLTINGVVASLNNLSNIAEVTAADQFDVDSNPNDKVDGQDDYAKASPASISLITGKVFDDMFGAKADEFDVLDKPIANVTIHLFRQGDDPLTATPVATTTTDVNGVYNFYVTAGSYLIYQVNPNNLLSVASLQSVDPDSGAATLDTTDPGFNTKTLNVIASSEYYENNFLDLTPLKISGNVYYDADKDGAALGDSGDLGLSTAQVGLFKANSAGIDETWGTADDVYTQVGSYVTVNNDGSYSFESLSPGRYKIVEVNPFGYSDIEDSDGNTNGNSQVELVLSGTTGDISNVNFLDNIQPGTIIGKVTFDADEDSAAFGDAEDTALSGVTVNLFAEGDDPLTATPIASATTDADGNFSFNGLAPGNYIVYQVNEANKDSVNDTDGANDDQIAVTLTIGESVKDIGFVDKIAPDSPPTVNITDNNGANSGQEVVIENETLAGKTFSLTTANTIAKITVGGQDITNAELLAASTTPITITTTKGVLTITNYDDTTHVVTYSYDPAGDYQDHSGGEITDDVLIEVTDGNNLTGSATLTILITDTEPLGVNDTDSIGEDASPNTVSGSVFINNGEDLTGADSPIKVIGVVSGEEVLPLNDNTTVASEIIGTYGKVVINEDGTYTYTLNNSNSSVQALNDTETLTDKFTYTIVDTDGSTSIATLTITINGATDAISVTVTDNNGLDDGDETVAENETLTNKTFSFSSTDPMDKITVAGSDVIYSELLDAGTNNITITTTEGTLTITGFDPATNTITYSYDPSGLNKDHSLGAVKDAISITVTDVYGRTDNTTLTILITDTTPTAVADTDSIEEDASPNTVSGSVFINNGEDLTGEDTPIKVIGVVAGSQSSVLNDNTTVGGEITGTYGKVVINEDGSYTYTLDNSILAVQNLTSTESLEDVFTYSITDSDGSTSYTTLTITINGRDDAISITVTDNNGLDDGDETVPENETLTDKTFSFSSTETVEKITIEGTDITYAELLNSSTTNVVITTTEGTLTITGFDSATNNVTYDYDPSGLNKDHTLGAVKDAISITVTDIYGRTDSTTLTILITDTAPTAIDDENSINEDDSTNTVSSSVFSGAGADLTGEDTPISVVGVEANVQDGGIDNLATVGAEITGSYGKVVINSDGSYTYTLDNTNSSVQALNDTETLTDKFTYTIKDTDGSTSFAILTITINGSTDSLSVNVVDNNGTEPGDETVSEDSTLSDKKFTISFTDDVDKLTIEGTDITYAELLDASTNNIVLTTTEGEMTISGYNPVTKEITYSYDPAGTSKDHSGGNVTDPISITITDIHGRTNNTTLTILITDTAPTAINDVNSITEDALPNTVSSSAFTGTGADLTGEDAPINVIGVESGVKASALNDALTVGNSITGSYGSIVVNSDGSYTYTLDNTNSSVQALNNSDTLHDIFTYSIIDSDGSTSFATIDITINGSTDTLSVDVIDNNAASSGDETVVENSSLTGKKFSITSTDAIDKLTIQGTDVPYADLLNSSTTNIVITTIEGTLTITGYNPTTNEITYNYDPTGTNKDHSGGEVTDPISIILTDVNGLTNTNTLTILITDTVPTAIDDTNSITEDVSPNNVGDSVFNGVGADLTGSDTPIGVVGVVAGDTGAYANNNATVGSSITGSYGSVVINLDGSYTYTLDNSNSSVQGLNNGDTLTDTFTYSITDSDGSTSFAKLTITINGMNEPYLDITVPDNNGTDIGDETVVENSSLNGKKFSFNNSHAIDKLTIQGTDISYTDLLNSGTTNIQITTTEGILTITGYNDTTKEITYSYDPNGTSKNHGSGSVTDPISIVITDVNGVTGNATLTILITDTVPTAINDANSVTEDASTNTVSSSLFTGLGADLTGEDTPISVVGVAAGNTGSYLDSNGTIGNSILGFYGSVVINSDGSYTYTLDNANSSVQSLNNGDTLSDTFTYSIVDSDGSTSFATLTITINGANEPYADLVTTKILQSENKIYHENDLVSFVIEVKNIGLNDTTNVQLQEIVPDGLEFVSATPSAGSFDSITGLWQIGNLANNQSATMVITFKVIVNETTNITNTVSRATSDLQDPTDNGNDLNETINVLRIEPFVPETNPIIVQPDSPHYELTQNEIIVPEQQMNFDPAQYVLNAVSETRNISMGIPYYKEVQLTSASQLMNWDPALYVLPAVSDAAQNAIRLSNRLNDIGTGLSSQLETQDQLSPLRRGLMEALNIEFKNLDLIQQNLQQINTNPEEELAMNETITEEESKGRKSGSFSEQMRKSIN